MLDIVIDTNYNITLLPSLVGGAYEWMGMEEMCVDTRYWITLCIWAEHRA